jgi:hypothetical protein
MAEETKTTEETKTDTTATAATTADTTAAKTEAANAAKNTVVYSYRIDRYTDGRYAIVGLPIDGKVDKDGKAVPSINFDNAVRDIIGLGEGLDEETKANRIAAEAEEKLTEWLNKSAAEAAVGSGKVIEPEK